MSMRDWFRKKPASGGWAAGRHDTGVGGEEPGRAIDEAVDPESGEISRATEPAAAAPRARRGFGGNADSSTVQGERAIPSVNREQSIQSRVSSGLALAAVLLLGFGFLAWYYTTQFSKTREAEEAAKKANAARAAGEMKVPPLGRIEPPGPATPSAPTPIAADVLGPAPLPPQAGQGAAAAGQGGPPPKTPEQLALERMLGAPVLMRTQFTQSDQARGGMQPGGPQAAGQAPTVDTLLRGLQGRGTASEGQGSPGGLEALLRPTPTPAVAAQVVPTRRFLLPKGAFIDCTLETAIDSTYQGMTTCIGAHDVYSADGKVVLLERGTKYVGEQKGDVKLGQSRVFVLWNEARTPTGVVVNLASPGTDELGRAGLPGFVDTHFWDRFGAAILISVIDGALQAIASGQQSGNTTVVLNPQGTRDIMTEVLKSTVAIPPTVVKNQGERIQVLVARDVDFRPVYALRNDGTAQ